VPEMGWRRTGLHLYIFESSSSITAINIKGIVLYTFSESCFKPEVDKKEPTKPEQSTKIEVPKSKGFTSEHESSAKVEVPAESPIQGGSHPGQEINGKRENMLPT